MHRTEGANNVGGLYTEGPPPTTITAGAMNALQEEICGVIEATGIELKSGDTDTYDQLEAAIRNLVDDEVALGQHMVNYDIINEFTAGSGVTVDGVLIRDQQVNCSRVAAEFGIAVNNIFEFTAGSGVTVDGVFCKDSAVYVNNIFEFTAGSGVTVDGVLCKDSKVGDTPSYTTVAFSVGSGNVYYFKDVAGFVHVHGNGDGVPAAGTFYTMPAGYRPSIPNNLIQNFQCRVEASTGNLYYMGATASATNYFTLDYYAG